MRIKPVLASSLVGVLALGTGIAGSETIRGHRVGGGHSTSHHGHYGGGHFSHYYYPYYPYYAYAYYYAPWYPVYVGHGPGFAPAFGYIDTDVSPKKAEVYLDGVYVGIADNFDGFPRHLSTEPGAHVITFKAEGHRTTTRKIRIPRGAIVKLDFRMIEGVGEDDSTLAGDLEVEAAPATPDDTTDLEWEETEGPGFVRLMVSPAGASVYLDGEFYAPASTLMGLHGKLRIESGAHFIEVVNPGYVPARKEFELAPGDRLSMTIVLEKEPGH